MIRLGCEDYDNKAERIVPQIEGVKIAVSKEVFMWESVQQSSVSLKVGNMSP